MTTPARRLVRWRTTAYAAWAIIGVLILLGLAGYALGRVSGALAPFVIGFLFVFLLQGPVAWFQSRGVKRGAAVAICFAVAFVTFSLIVVFIFPPIARQLVAFAQAVPSALDQGQSLLTALQHRFSDLVIPAWLSEALTSVTQSVARVFTGLGSIIAKGLISFGSGFATVVFDLFLGAVVAFWTLRDLPTIRRELAVLAGPKWRDDLDNLISTLGRVVGGYLRGQTIASVTTGALAGVALAIIGVPYALVIGIIACVFNYVPYVGPLFTGVIAAAIGFFASPLLGVLAVVIVIVAQQVTDLFVTPRVMSDQVDLHPTLVIFSLLVGGSLFGFWGMIFAIPVAATAKGLFVYYWEQRTSRQLATETGALFRASQCDDAPADEECEDETETGGTQSAAETDGKG